MSQVINHTVIVSLNYAHIFLLCSIWSLDTHYNGHPVWAWGWMCSTRCLPNICWTNHEKSCLQNFLSGCIKNQKVSVASYPRVDGNTLRPSQLKQVIYLQYRFALNFGTFSTWGPIDRYICEYSTSMLQIHTSYYWNV